MTANLRFAPILKVLLLTLTLFEQGDNLLLTPNCKCSTYGPEITRLLKNQHIPAPCYDVTGCTTPVDPVSLSLALQANKDCVREEKLQFGPKNLPIDIRACIIPNHLNDALIDLESGLHGFRNQVVKLKPCCPKENHAQEAIDPCCCGEDIFLETYREIPLLTYKDVGYELEKPKCPKFVPGVPSVSCPCSSQGEILFTGSVPPALLANRLALPAATANPFCACSHRKN